jgi:sigma-B regulation protein RsbU (phosphoserine phosphatase)
MLSRNNKTISQLEGEVQRLKSAVEELTVLNDLAITASSSLEVDQVLDIIVEKSIKAVQAEQGSILLVTHQQENPLQTLIRQADRHSHMLNYKVGSHITGWVLKHNQPLIVENLSKDQRFYTTEEERKNIHSLLGVPIQFRGKIIGILTVTNKKSSSSFSKDDLRLLSIIAAQSGQLIRNSQLQQEALEKERLTQELATARTMQMALLPKQYPTSPYFELACFFSPAEEVGGDYYDFFQLNDQQLGIVQADASGHGTSAAMIMTMLKGILHSITHQFCNTAEALGEINKILLNSAPPDVFVTMAFLLLDPPKRTLEFSNAGHLPPLLFSQKHGQLQLLENQGCALNCDENSVYQTKQLSLDKGDCLCIFTDGLIEAFNSRTEMYSLQRLKDLLEKSARNSAEEIIADLKNSLENFLGSTPQTDDIAAVVIKMK